MNIISRAPDALKLISNFADTPFVLDDLDYGSIEAFWQGLKFPGEAQRRDRTAARRHGKGCRFLCTKGGYRHLRRSGHRDWGLGALAIDGARHDRQV
jgi:hypothetical protein